MISIHAPREGGDAPLHNGHAALGISIHAPREGGDLAICHGTFGRLISIHAPREGGRPMMLYPYFVTTCHFNPRPREGGDVLSLSIAEKWVFQSTPPRGGATEQAGIFGIMFDISIHAPARGATYRCNVRCVNATFQSTPPRGGRRRHPIYRACNNQNFNPRPREGGDKVASAASLVYGISIHAPARGATSAPVGNSFLHCDFNPRPREGGDCGGHQEPRAAGRFQSTPPRGGRRSLSMTTSYYMRFQSTPPRGGRRAGGGVGVALC